MYQFYWKNFNYSIDYFYFKPHRIDESVKLCDFEIDIEYMQFFYSDDIGI